MKTKFNGFLTLLLALVVQISFAQEKTISGTVSDESGGLPGVSVIIKGTIKGTETDFDGKYSVNAKSGDVLVFSYLGYKKVEKAIGASNTINVIMVEDANVLEEIVIESAYDIKRSKPTVNSSITSVGAETIENRPNASIIQTLQGQAAGVNITTGSGQPGANSEVIIRGVGSINGNIEPLFIIDGIPVDRDNFRSLNPNNIASVTVLKDAGATAIYGNRGANGVIIIKTKSGKFNSPLKVEYSMLTSFSTLQGNDYDLMNSTEQLTLERTYGAGVGGANGGISDNEIAARARFSNTDWVNVFFRTAMTQSHNLRLSSGSESTTTNVSLGFFDQSGILKQSDLKRFNIDAKINGKSKNSKFNYGLGLSLNYSKSNEPNAIGGGAINRNYVLGAYMSVPYVSPSQYVPGGGADIPVIFSLTPLFLLDRLDTYTRFEEEVKSLISLNANYELFEGLKIGTRLGMDYTNVLLTRAEAPESFNAQLFAGDEDADEPGRQVTTPGFQSQQTTRAIGINILNSINYSTIINDDHTIDAGLYMEYFRAHRRGFGYFEEGLDPKTFSPGDGSGFVGDNADNDLFVDVANANVNDAGLLSYFANANYDYKKKYGFGATIRRDASYRFRTSNRWGTFWSVSGRWNIDKENFMSDSPFSLLKLRASYGVTGNQDIVSVGGFNQYFAAANRVLDLYGTGAGYGGQNSIFAAQVANDDLKWETTTQGNIGLDFEVFDRKLTGSLDYYVKETSDLFVGQRVRSLLGVTNISINSDGTLKNSGVDLTLGYTPINNGDLRVKFTVSGNYNKSERFGANLSTIEEGGPLGQYYTLRYAGVNPANGNQLFLDATGNVTETPNTDTDRVFSGKTRFPDYQGSVGFDIDYKNFFLQANMTYAIGVDRFDGDYNDATDPTAIGQFRHSRDILRAWTPTNRITDIPALRATNLAIGSDRFLKSADYLRLRFVSFGYNLPKEVTDKINLSGVRAFINGENLVTFSGWRGYDVEGFASTGRSYPTPRTVSFGLEIGF